ncbi:hypothetical protein HOV30_gp170 [Erwinia phage Derbicus]|uniref:Uncharacterized protein n=1 Tax=Erwinia phage Derbicus TaxID=2530027 RepID=A0A482II13_9CAUD|nr:hypothetical protein HOV30_gp170 [Erwinia phage Derbicus]QBP07596.1 hypothetical protein DERBICUS_170 [Erwinia phage Derbicus]
MRNEKLVRGIETLLNRLADKQVDFEDFGKELATLLAAVDNRNWAVVEVPTISQLNWLAEWASSNHGIDTTQSGTGTSLHSALQGVSDAIYAPYGDGRPEWFAFYTGKKLLVKQAIRGETLYAAVLEQRETTEHDSTGEKVTLPEGRFNGHLLALRDRVKDSYSDLATRSVVREALVHAINRSTGMRWKLTEVQLSAGGMIEGLFAATFPSDDLLQTLAKYVRDGVQEFYSTKITVVPSMKTGMVGMARCMEVCLEARDTDMVYRVNALMTLDDVDMFDMVDNTPTPSLSDQHILESIPDSGDRSRNEPVYLMSAKATRSLLDGRLLDRSLDDIRRVAKQQGWSDVQAFGQQLLFSC